MNSKSLLSAGAVALVTTVAVGAWTAGLMPSTSQLALAAASKPDARSVALPIPKNRAVITLGGGCFWSMEAIYKRIKGVDRATPGYAGGTVSNPTYEQVGTGTTGHAEALQIVYDPKVVSYGELVEVLLTVLDPTTLNRQGADVGTNYRSVIFTRNAGEEKVARAMIGKVNARGIWSAPIVTQVVPISGFTRAEDYHQNYYDTHSNLPYCQAVIVPKLDKLKQKFAAKLK